MILGHTRTGPGGAIHGAQPMEICRVVESVRVRPDTGVSSSRAASRRNSGETERAQKNPRWPNQAILLSLDRPHITSGATYQISAVHVPRNPQHGKTNGHRDVPRIVYADVYFTPHLTPIASAWHLFARYWRSAERESGQRLWYRAKIKYANDRMEHQR